MNIPPAYKWLSAIEPLPKTISIALALHGVAEVIEKGSNQTILGWRDELKAAGVSIVGYSDDDIPWCGLFAGIVCYRRRQQATEVVSSPLWARNWAKYGVMADRPSLGDVLVFSRGPTSGHVGFYIAEDASAYHVLGGNQGDRVSITRILKSRLIAARRPPYQSQPATVQPYRITTAGSLSINEA